MKSNAKQIEFADLERLNLHIETLTAEATKTYVTELLDGIEKMKNQNDIEPVPEYSAALYAANEQLRIICKSKHITDGQVAKSIKISGAWFSECNLPPENKRARLPKTMQRRLYNIIQGRKNALFALFASRKWNGVDADEFVQGVRSGELDV